ncbi:MAG: alanine racemase [Oscillospiraceae bacterium]|nr:alanine racemase [Oscillospiraceae bacterium]
MRCCPTKAYISYSALEYNYNTLRSLLPEGCGFVGVVKSNAYGHGAIEVARKLELWGCEYLAVANLAEALELRGAGITLPILILGITAPEHTKTLIDNNLTQTIADNATAKAYSQRAVKLGKSLKCHLKLDTGMGRIGFFSLDGGESDISAACTAVRELNLSYEGVFTHFATSDVGEDGGNTSRQFKSFISAVDAIESATGRKFRLRHCANSGATVCYPETHLDMVRPGIALYGYAPENPSGIKLRPVMTVKSRVVQLRTPAAGSGVSYGRTYITGGGEKLAVIPMGYNDGLFRLLSNKISFVCKGKMIPQVGRICMDMCMADASAAGDVQIGDEVIIFGEKAMSAQDMAESIGTISYELLCAMDRRVGRVYID